MIGCHCTRCKNGISIIEPFYLCSIMDFSGDDNDMQFILCDECKSKLEEFLEGKRVEEAVLIE